jgi:hypothetical protein
MEHDEVDIYAKLVKNPSMHDSYSPYMKVYLKPLSVTFTFYVVTRGIKCNIVSRW